ncbi:MAG: metallophosphoesterase family protein [Planctomycetota bacterium]|jgi:predicted phosphodiesterase|nr:metallophosphoesterase family protein [Planctomycetota bacterium]MDP7129739.1 metallophosphoesterase family protein [Planctomycetota bacterium]MDP7250376.1 metallophosphoesterase family protein [Planctomycetota bacterium]
MQAIVSDIHGNLEAFSTILEDIENQGVDEILCLGDVVGYGPNPIECLDLAMENCKWVLCGNHEWALVNQPVGFSPPAKRAIELTRKLFEKETDSEQAERRKDFLFNLEPNVEDGNVMYVHGSPKDPIMDYVFPEQFSRFWTEEKVDDLLRTVEWVCFCGHSHVPSIISSAYESIVPTEDVESYALDPEKVYIINAGAVGQPRDRNNKACYAIWDGDAVTHRRLAYDHEATAAKIREIGFDEKLASRLAEGT